MRLRIRAMKRHGHASSKQRAKGDRWWSPPWFFATAASQTCSPDEATLLRLLRKLRRVRVRRGAERVGGSEIRENFSPSGSLPGFRYAPPGLRKNERKNIGGETPT